MSRLQVHLLIAFSLLIFKYFKIVQSDCVLHYPLDTEKLPKYEKYIGKYKLQIPHDDFHIQLQDGEIINGFCDTHFDSFHCLESYYYDYYNHGTKPTYYYDQSSITLTCNNTQLLYNGHPLGESTLKCAKQNWTIYATEDSYSWCEKYQYSTTFLLATKSNADQHILAGICYNLEQLSLKAVTYNVTYYQRNYMKKLMEMSKTNRISQQSLVDDLWNFKTTKSLEKSSEKLQLELLNLGKNNFWLQIANYEVSSIVQGDSYGNYFKEYTNILDAIWWRNLRLGNWKSFMNTLENYAYNNSFQLYTGTSGAVRYPSKSNEDENNILEILMGVKNETVPAYIWTYLKSNDNTNQDFIIVGYNSPYTEFFSLKNIIFCPDICSEIPWLNDIRSSFRYATAGIMFCCSTDFIKQTNYLNGFPRDILMSHHLENTTEIDVTTEINITTEIVVPTDINLVNAIEHNTESLLNSNIDNENSA